MDQKLANWRDLRQAAKWIDHTDEISLQIREGFRGSPADEIGGPLPVPEDVCSGN
jgi:hypothetical protein